MPTVGGALDAVGYDRDFAAVAVTGPALRIELRPVPGWQAVRVDRDAATVQVPSGVELDLGATAKALCADRAARAVVAETGSGVLVNLGGDISVAGPPPEEGWVVRMAHHHAEPPETAGPTLSLRSGGLATSSTSVRRWARGGQTMHHLIDPSTGGPAEEYWRTVSVAAGSCLDANIASCAAVVLGPAAPRMAPVPPPARPAGRPGRPGHHGRRLAGRPGRSGGRRRRPVRSAARTRVPSTSAATTWSMEAVGQGAHLSASADGPGWMGHEHCGRREAQGVGLAAAASMNSSQRRRSTGHAALVEISDVVHTARRAAASIGERLDHGIAAHRDLLAEVDRCAAW